MKEIDAFLFAIDILDTCHDFYINKNNSIILQEWYQHADKPKLTEIKRYTELKN